MTSIIKADDGSVSGVTGINSTADTSGTLEFQATSQQISMANVTGALTIPVGTTAQRPASPVNGQARYNTTINQFEVYQNGNWIQYASTYSSDVLLVAGGGSGGIDAGSGGNGGGGAGGLIDTSLTFISGISYPIVIGAGGNARSGAVIGDNGGNTTGFSLTAIGGGGGGTRGSGGPASGGSGGGAGNAGSGAQTGASGTSGQGFAGGNQGANSGSYAAGGGGGAGGVGANGNSSANGGNGGVGVNWKSLGTFYAGGGGGGTHTSPGTAGGIGGNGGGGNGGFDTSPAATSGTANTGGGGGGNGRVEGNSGAGGSGIVIVRYLGAQKGTGGTVTSAGGYTYHTFTSSGTYTA
jgi:hypothetical protein